MGRNYYSSFESFIESAMDITLQRPVYARVVIKYNRRQNKVVLKVTDDSRWALFKITHDDQIEQLDKFVKIMSQLLSNRQFATDQMEEEENRHLSPEKKKNQKKKRRA